MLRIRNTKFVRGPPNYLLDIDLTFLQTMNHINRISMDGRRLRKKIRQSWLFAPSRSVFSYAIRRVMTDIPIFS